MKIKDRLNVYTFLSFYFLQQDDFIKKVINDHKVNKYKTPKCLGE